MEFTKTNINDFADRLEAHIKAFADAEGLVFTMGGLKYDAGSVSIKAEISKRLVAPTQDGKRHAHTLHGQAFLRAGAALGLRPEDLGRTIQLPRVGKAIVVGLDVSRPRKRYVVVMADGYAKPRISEIAPVLAALAA